MLAFWICRLVICALATPERSGEITAYSYSNCFSLSAPNIQNELGKQLLCSLLPLFVSTADVTEAVFFFVFFFALSLSQFFERQQDDGYSCALCGAMIHPTTPENN